jgi:hypothetical protein
MAGLSKVKKKCRKAGVMGVEARKRNKLNSAVEELLYNTESLLFWIDTYLAEVKSSIIMNNISVENYYNPIHDLEVAATVDDLLDFVEEGPEENIVEEVVDLTEDDGVSNETNIANEVWGGIFRPCTAKSGKCIRGVYTRNSATTLWQILQINGDSRSKRNQNNTIRKRFVGWLTTQETAVS